ncbi:MAG: DUF4265 domain-containing protein [Chitinophagales bacterium]
MSEPSYIQVTVEQENEEGKVIAETMWTTKIGEHFRIENIPFYVTDLAFHDLVKAELIEETLLATTIVEEGGHSTIRIYFKADEVEKVRAFFTNQGCHSELSSNPKWLAINIPPQINYTKIRAYLEEGENKDLWEYEEGCLAHEV